MSVLAKVTGKPIVINNEVTGQESGMMEVEFQILEGQESLGTKLAPTLATVSFPPIPPKAILLEEPVKSSTKGENTGALEIELPPNSLKHFEKNNEVIILAPEEIPQHSRYRIKGYAGSFVLIDFLEFVEVCKTNDSADSPRLEYATKIFDSMSPAVTKGYNLVFYAPTAGFSNVCDWLNALNVDNKIPEGKTNRRMMFYLYRIRNSPINC